MLFELVMKDFVLIKKYLALFILYAIGFPISISNQMDTSAYGGFIIFLMVAIVIQFISFASACTKEYRSRGSILLCATPYTRKSLVQAKYLFNLVTFIFCYLTYSACTFILPNKVISVSISELGLSLLISSVLFGIYIPVQYKLGFEKTRVIFQLSAVAIPFILLFIVKLMRKNNVSLDISMAPVLQDVLPLVASAVIVFISMALSIRIYSKKDL